MEQGMKTASILYTFAKHSDRNAQLLLESLRQVEPSDLHMNALELTKLRQDIIAIQREARVAQILAEFV